MFRNQTPHGSIDAEIARLEEQIDALRQKKIEDEKNMKKARLLVSLNSFSLAQVMKMPDFELADKSRKTSLFALLSMLTAQYNIQLAFPVELVGKSIAQVLYVMDYIGDEEKLEQLEIPETMQN